MQEITLTITIVYQNHQHHHPNNNDLSTVTSLHISQAAAAGQSPGPHARYPLWPSPISPTWLVNTKGCDGGWAWKTWRKTWRTALTSLTFIFGNFGGKNFQISWFITICSMFHRKNCNVTWDKTPFSDPFWEFTNIHQPAHWGSAGTASCRLRTPLSPRPPARRRDSNLMEASTGWLVGGFIPKYLWIPI